MTKIKAQKATAKSDASMLVVTLQTDPGDSHSSLMLPVFNSEESINKNS